MVRVEVRGPRATVTTAAPIEITPTVRVYVSAAPVDMRKSFDGLSIAVTSVLDLDPTSGHLFCFFNRRASWPLAARAYRRQRVSRFSLALPSVPDRRARGRLDRGVELKLGGGG